MALYACMYFAALRPAEAVGLRRQDCTLPGTGWGRLTLEKSRPEVNRRWTDNDSAHSERRLKHRAADESRRIPIPPELVAILRAHIETFGVAPNQRIFSSERGQSVASTLSATSGPKRGPLRWLPFRLLRLWLAGLMTSGMPRCPCGWPPGCRRSG